MQYRGYTISSHPHPRGDGYVGSAHSSQGANLGPFRRDTQAEAEQAAQSAVDEALGDRGLTGWRDLDKRPLTDRELKERASALPVPPTRPRKHPLSRFLEEE